MMQIIHDLKNPILGTIFNSNAIQKILQILKNKQSICPEELEKLQELRSTIEHENQGPMHLVENFRFRYKMKNNENLELNEKLSVINLKELEQSISSCHIYLCEKNQIDFSIMIDSAVS